MVHKFDLVHDVFRATVDIADLVGIYFVMQRVAGKKGDRPIHPDSFFETLFSFVRE